MATLGQTFKEARQRRKISASQAAAATRMKVQHIEAIEKDDFSRMAAPMYSKGFIKLYAEYLDLDPAPFIAEYTELHAPRERLPLIAEDTKPEPKRESVVMNFIRVIDWTAIRGMLVSGWRYAAIGLIVAIVLVVSIRMLSRPKPQVAEEFEQPAPVVTPPVVRHPLPVIKDPPMPYAEIMSQSTGTP